MKDKDKTQERLIRELTQLRQRIADLEASECERKQVEEALKRSEQEKAAVFDSISEHVVYQDTRMRVLWANRAAGESVGMDTQQLVGRHCYEIWQQRRKPCVGCPVVKARKSGQPQEAEMTTPDGRVWFIRGYPVRDANGNITSAVEVTLEITDRKQMEQELRESEEKLKNIVENSTNIFYSHTPEHILTYQSPQVKDLLGYEPDEAMVRWTEFASNNPNNEEGLKLTIKAIETGKPQPPYELELVHKNGKKVWVEVREAPVVVNGKTISIVGALTDITERKRADEELKHSYAQLQETLLTTVNALTSMVEMKDRYTAGHQPRVAQLACAIAKEMGLSEEQIEGIRMAGLVHDIGNIMVPAEILSKPGQLTEMQYNMVKMHSQAGYDILKEIKFPWPVAQIVLQHHERMDGSGYPQGLSGEKILLEARILAVANIVEAMTSHRPYRPAYDIKASLQEISQNKGVFYDPGVVDVCLKLFTKKRFAFD